jgi:thiosulfate/3-mercaptopyruvate sulfurtransferase
MIKSLIKVNELAQNLSNPQYIIVDCRFDLVKPEWGYSNYLEGHIPGASYADLNKDLSNPITEVSGRHPLPDPDKFLSFLSNLGIDKQKNVVAYDTTYGSNAARFWWLLRAYGHKSVALLNGGIQAWVAAGKPLEKGSVPPKFSKFVGKFNEDFLVTQEQVEKKLGSKEYLLIDARSPIRYAGIEELIDSAAGHIPGAVNVFHQDHLDANGFLLSNENLQKLYSFLPQKQKEENIVLYCGSGVTSCFNLFALSQIGMNKPKLYAGSWSEWIKNPKHPINRDER